MSRFVSTADCWFLTGPTASGKTQAGIELARRLGAEILSLDSMAVYRRMDVGTAKPCSIERVAVTHHLLDLVEPHEEFSVTQYLQAARTAVDDVRGRGRQVLFVGGTPLYLKALLRGISEGPPADWEFRRRMAREARLGTVNLHARVTEIDPSTAARLHPNDTRRLIRAIEVFEKTGTPISRLQHESRKSAAAPIHPVFVLQWGRSELAARIEERVEAMFRNGLIAEVEGLLRLPAPLSRTASQAVGYREVIAHLMGQHDLATTKDLVKTRTRQFAKRQATWFRSLTECRPVPMADDFVAAEVAERIVAEAGARRKA